MKITVRANAKLNLTLDVVGKRDDDYHLLESVMQSVSLYDTVTVRTDESEDISVYTNNDSISDDQTNIAWRAADAFFRATGQTNPGLDIRIKKRIPTGSGMGGGSADGAAVIIAQRDIQHPPFRGGYARYRRNGRSGHTLLPDGRHDAGPRHGGHPHPSPRS